MLEYTKTLEKVKILDTYIAYRRDGARYKRIEFKSKRLNAWLPIDMEGTEPNWNWEHNDYRVVDTPEEEMKELRKEKWLAKDKAKKEEKAAWTEQLA